jgi:hypothetical protein
MKTTNRNFLLIILIFLATSCVTTVKFPISTIEPAAEITAKINKDNQNNYVIQITANYLASVERLTPPKSTYVVWIVTKENGIKNIGLLKSENAKKINFKTLSAFEPYEIFITAEDEGTISRPSGIEITRVVLKSYY